MAAKMETNIIDSQEPSDLVIEALTTHLPYSLPLLRRLQWPTSSSHVLSTFDKEAPGQEFLAAYVDLHNCPETEIWLYSSLENPNIPTNEAVCEEQVMKVFARVREIEKNFQGQRQTPGTVLVATLHARILETLEKHSLVKSKTEEHFKFIFRMEDVPTECPLPEGLSWSSIRPSDIPLVLSRTAIPYQSKTMARLPSVAITTHTGNPIAWVFLGLDGSMKVLHCEEKYRARGLAKAVASKLLREKVSGQDGLSHADVAVENLQSRGVCKSLGGTPSWSVYFVWVNLKD